MAKHRRNVICIIVVCIATPKTGPHVYMLDINEAPHISYTLVYIDKYVYTALLAMCSREVESR